MNKISRNKPCPCGSGKKNKYCCGGDMDSAGPNQYASANHFSMPRNDRHTNTPAQAEMLNEQGNVCAELKRYDEAVKCYERALAINPNFAGAYNNLGIVFRELGKFDEAISCYEKSIGLLTSIYASSYNNMGIALKEQGKNLEAIACYRHARDILPDSVQINTNLGNIYYDLKVYIDAIDCYLKVLESGPDYYILTKLVIASLSVGNLSATLDYCEQALEIHPDSPEILSNMGYALSTRGRFDAAYDCYSRAMAIDPDSVDLLSAKLMMGQYEYTSSCEALFDDARRLAEKFELPLRGERISYELIREPGNRLRVGLVSADLRSHSVGYFLEAVLRHIDQGAFALIAYANQKSDDDLSERIKPCFESWVAVAGMTDVQLAEQIRQDKIDLLIDLSGHSHGNRLLTFARKPAPVQATWLGYPNTTGFDTMDYIIADPITLPPEEERYYSEKVWRLPETYICFTPPDLDLQVAELPARNNGTITFGSFNNPAKINDTVIDCWAGILCAVPDSILLLKSKSFGFEVEKELFRQRFSNCGGDSSRIRFMGELSPREHLNAYNTIDMALDPFPYTGVTTTCEALWMGVPTLTLRMERGMFGHNGELIMKLVGLDDWVVESIEEYRERAVAFAAKSDWLASLRLGLRQALLSSPLCTAERFARNLEQAFIGMVSASRGSGL